MLNLLSLTVQTNLAVDHFFNLKRQLTLSLQLRTPSLPNDARVDRFTQYDLGDTIAGVLP